MTEHDDRAKVIDSWHIRANAYGVLVRDYRIFTDMAMSLVEFVNTHRANDTTNLHVMDLAAGTGLVSKLLIKHAQVVPPSLYLIEPAERMCRLAREQIPTAHVYQTTAEDCLSIPGLPRASFDFILSNASMHLMSENDIYPIVSQLLKPKTGYFLYTLWYHAFDETQDSYQNDELEMCINETLTSFNYPKYFPTTTSTKDRIIRSRQSLKETAKKHGLQLESCTIVDYEIPMTFDLDFLLMTPEWLVEHLKIYEWTQSQENSLTKEHLVETVRQLIKEKWTVKPVVRIILSNRTSS